MYISLYVVVNTFIGGRQPQNKLMRLRTFKKHKGEINTHDQHEHAPAPNAHAAQLFAEKLHERFVRSLRTAGVGKDPLKRVCSCIGATYRGLQGRQHRKKQFSPKNGQKLPIFLPKIVFF